MIVGLCLSFLSLQGSEQAHVPIHIRQLAFERLTHQLEVALPDHKVSFDEPECANEGTYYFDSQNIVLSGDNALWRGRLQISLTDLLDGRKIPLAAHLQNAQKAEEPQLHPEPARRRWLPWLIAGGAALVVGGAALYYQQSKSNRPAASPPEPSPVPSSGSPEGPKPLSF
jgi:hypothetical protein